MQGRPYSVQFDPTKGMVAARFEETVSERARRAYEAGQRVGENEQETSGSRLDAPV